jgi:hypothetical protein
MSHDWPSPSSTRQRAKQPRQLENQFLFLSHGQPLALEKGSRPEYRVESKSPQAFGRSLPGWFPWPQMDKWFNASREKSRSYDPQSDPLQVGKDSAISS